MSKFRPFGRTLFWVALALAFLYFTGTTWVCLRDLREAVPLCSDPSRLEGQETLDLGCCQARYEGDVWNCTLSSGSNGYDDDYERCNRPGLRTADGATELRPLSAWQKVEMTLTHVLSAGARAVLVALLLTWIVEYFERRRQPVAVCLLFVTLSTFGSVFASVLASTHSAAAQETPASSTNASASVGKATAGESSPILAAYDFEESHPSGPDTFWAHETEDLRVDLSTAFRIRGERSLRVTDVAGNQDFAEFLGYFPERTEGAVFWQFYVLFTDVTDVHNFGVAGTEWFLDRQKHGQAFWLQLHEGRLRHHDANAWHDLFEVQPFRWYFVDWLYDVDRGTYDLRIFGEGHSGNGTEAPLVDVRRVVNYTGEAGSSVRYFSFIGDLDDETDPDFFVDDVLVAADPELRLAPFVAPGRRQLFVERWRAVPEKGIATESLIHETQRLVREKAVGQLDEMQLLRVEAAADTLVAAGRLAEAEALYTVLRDHPDVAVRALLKIADVRFLDGDVEGERLARESIYGRLGYEDEPVGHPADD